jgi:hypothetical protein
MQHVTNPFSLRSFFTVFSKHPADADGSIVNATRLFGSTNLWISSSKKHVITSGSLCFLYRAL